MQGGDSLTDRRPFYFANYPGKIQGDMFQLNGKKIHARSTKPIKTTLHQLSYMDLLRAELFKQTVIKV